MAVNSPRTSPTRLPPPLPPERVPPRAPPAAQVAQPRAAPPLAGARAYFAIRRIRMAAAWHGAMDWIRRRKGTVTLAVVAVVVAVGIGLAFAFDLVPDVPFLVPKVVVEARETARAHPSDAAAQRDLGHALWRSRRRHAAVDAYRRALAIDPSVADDQMVRHLVWCFGHRQQHEAESLIWRNKLVAAAPLIAPLVKSQRPEVRWGAVHTLDRLGKGTMWNWETGYMLDLESSDCEVRRRAVDKLGAIGTNRAVAALHAAKEEDAKTGGWFKERCLGGRLDDAEQKILARR